VSLKVMVDEAHPDLAFVCSVVLGSVGEGWRTASGQVLEFRCIGDEDEPGLEYDSFNVVVGGVSLVPENVNLLVWHCLFEGRLEPGYVRYSQGFVHDKGGRQVLMSTGWIPVGQ